MVALVPWYETHESSLSSIDDEILHRAQFGIPLDHEIRLPTLDQRPHEPPPGYMTFFQGQLEGGLLFPLPPFL